MPREGNTRRLISEEAIADDAQGEAGHVTCLDTPTLEQLIKTDVINF